MQGTHRKFRRMPIAAALLSLGLALGAADPVEARIVFDPQNYAENLLQATRALEQIKNQIASLQNEARMLENMAKELTPLGHSSLDALIAALRRIDALMRQAEGISFEIGATRQALERYYAEDPLPDAATAGLLAEAEARWRQALGAWRTTLALQSDMLANVRQDEATLAALVEQSQGAVGSLQAEQAGNQLLALAAKQQLQIQTLLAAQFRADALEEAGKAKAEEAARATTERFLGAGTAYTPH